MKQTPVSEMQGQSGTFEWFEKAFQCHADSSHKLLASRTFVNVTVTLLVFNVIWKDLIMFLDTLLCLLAILCAFDLHIKG